MLKKKTREERRRRRKEKNSHQYNNEKAVDAVDDGLYSPPTYYTST